MSRRLGRDGLITLLALLAWPTGSLLAAESPLPPPPLPATAPAATREESPAQAPAMPPLPPLPPEGTRPPSETVPPAAPVRATPGDSPSPAWRPGGPAKPSGPSKPPSAPAKLRPAAAPQPVATPQPAAVVALIQVALAQQQLIATDANGRVLLRRAVSTGLPQSPTPTGRFWVAGKYDRTTLTGRDYRIAGVRHVMCLAGAGLRPDAVCFHPAPWQEAAGQRFGVRRSHGCVRLPSSTALWLFQHTAVGTPVWIRP